METHIARPWIAPDQLQRLNGGHAILPATFIRPSLRQRLVLWARLNGLFQCRGGRSLAAPSKPTGGR